MCCENNGEIILQGVGASQGFGIGQAFVLLQKESEVPVYEISDQGIDGEIARFHKAIGDTRSELHQLKRHVSGQLSNSEAQIFDAHLLVLEDQAIISETILHCRKNKCNIDHSYHAVSQHYTAAFNGIEDNYLKERAADIRDVARRLLRNLLHEKQGDNSGLQEPHIVVSQDISPSDAASWIRNKTLAVVTEGGGRTSHAVIMARSLGVPAVIGVGEATRKINDGDTILVNGYEGIVVIRPTQTTLDHYQKLIEQKNQLRDTFLKEVHLPPKTPDGHTVSLYANIEGTEDLASLQSADVGVGLLRTEVFFLRGETFPDEEEQYQMYRQVAEGLAPRPVIIRTLDLGGDKCKSVIPFARTENNPFMGFRAIRLCLEHKSLFKTQLRAILRASAHGNVRILYPMIGSTWELIQANELLEEARQELSQHGQVFGTPIEVGSMIEIPAAAFTADLIAEHCSYLSIGTNDLIQYMLAVDRVNERISHLYEPNHPAVLRMVKHVIDAGHKKGVPVTMCGEMASDPLYIPLLIGMGIDGLSVAPTSLPEVKFLIRHTPHIEAQALSQDVLRTTTPKVILSLLKNFHLKKLRAYI